MAWAVNFKKGKREDFYLGLKSKEISDRDNVIIMLIGLNMAVKLYYKQKNFLSLRSSSSS